MIITNVCLLLEALSIVICLHHLYGEKFRLDIETVSLLTIDMILMYIIEYFSLPNLVSILMYLVIAIYCGIKFGFKLKPMIINIILCVIIVGGMQMLEMLLGYFLFQIHDFSDIKLLLVDSATFLIIFIILPLFRVERLPKFFQDNAKIVVAVIGVCLTWLLFCLLNFKNFNSMELKQEIMLFVSIILVLILAGQLNKYKIKAKEVETELRMHELYSEPFQELIDNIRLRQHEFDNHINAIYSLHYSCRTLEELIEAQESYCEKIIRENRFCKLISSENSVIRGFLYTKFVKIDRMGIEVSYHVALGECDIGVPVYKIVEILGDLINNAVEALESEKARKKLHVAIIEKDRFCIEVRNESQYIAYDMLGNFFAKGYSKKGENRGLGLYNVKQICEEYGLEVAPECKEIDGTNWLSFKVWKVD